MSIGIDFDNTIIRYDGAFAAAAREKGLVPGGVAPTKLAVRDHLRAAGREDEWTLLQAEIYGPGIRLASPFPGVLDFLRACRETGTDVYVVSHKTRTPYMGPAYDLHAHARDWLETNGFFDENGAGLRPDAVFFEPTKAAKAARIAALGVTHFIDDLPEFLAELDGAGLERILFDPNQEHASEASFARAFSWEQLARTLLTRQGRL